MKKIFRLIALALSNEEIDYTKGSVNRALVLLAIPMILEMLMESLFAVVDIFFVAQVGVDAVSTIGLTESVITLIYSVGIGMSMAATAMVARRIGEKKPEDAAKAAGQAILMAVTIAVALGVPGFIYADDILRLMGGSEKLIAEGVGYTRIMLGTNIVIILLFLLNGVFRGAGDASLAMVSLWIANGINIVLDPLLILGIGPFPELGVEGAAVATLIGRSIGVSFQLFILFGGSGVIKLRFSHFKIDWGIISRLAKVSATGAGQFLIASASWIFLMRIIALFGSQAIAGYTIGIRLIIFTILPAMGISNAAATLVGQNLGAKQPERAVMSVNRAAIFNMAFLFSVSLIYVIFSYPIVHLFSTEPNVVEASVLTLRILCAGYVIFAYAMVAGSAFNGAGDTFTPTVVNFICFWCIEIPLGYLLAVYFDWQLPGVCWAIVISESLMALILFFLYRQGNWKTVEI